MNTRILPVDFDYVAPKTLAEALTILKEKKNVRIFAGGTDLTVRIKMDLENDMALMLDINHIDELKVIKVDEKAGEAYIGAAAKLKDVREHPVVCEKYLALREAIFGMGAAAIQNMGTPGGNFGNANPSADTAGPMMCFGAKVRLVSADGERLVPASEFFIRPGVSVKAENELIAGFVLPLPAANTGSCFVKKGRTKADISRISITVVIARDGNKIAKAQIAIGSVAPTPLFRSDLAEMLDGKVATPELFDEVGLKAGDTIHPRTTPEYRKTLGHIMMVEVLELAWKRAGGEL